MQYITKDIDDAVAGSLKHPPKTGKRVLVCNEAGTAALQVLAALSLHFDLQETTGIHFGLPAEAVADRT
jgi:hypothetical protein